MNGLLVGRFQPFHLGHAHAIRFALSRVDKLWLGIGSSGRPAEKNNPFSADERKAMISHSLDPQSAKNIEIYNIPDLDDHVKWMENLDGIVPEYQVVFSSDEMTRHLYLKRNKEVISAPFIRRGELSGTNIRARMTGDQDWQSLVPEGTKKILEKIGARDRLEHL